MFGSTGERALRRMMRRYQGVIQANPRDLEARLRLAEIFRRLGQEDDAREELAIVAGACAKTGDVLAAMATLHEILEIDPTHRETLQLVASLYARPEPVAGGDDDAPEFAILVGLGGVLAVTPAPLPPHTPAAATRDDDEPSSVREVTHPGRAGEPIFLLTTPSAAKEAVDADLSAARAEGGPSSPDEADDVAEAIGVDDIVEELPASERPHLPLFSSLRTEAFESVVARLRRGLYPAGAVLFDEGDPGDSVLLLVSGRVRVEKGLRGRNRFLVASLGPGALFGEFGYLTDRRRHARVTADADCEVLEATRAVLDDVGARHPEVAATLLELYGRRLVETASLFSPVLRLLDGPQRERWLGRFRRRAYDAGAAILREGERGEGLFVLLRGQVQVEKRGNGGDVRVATLGEGDFFGEASLLTGRPAMASVRADTAVETLRLPPRDFADLLSERPSLRALLQNAALERKLFTESLLAGKVGDASGAGKQPLV